MERLENHIPETPDSIRYRINEFIKPLAAMLLPQAE
jgi:hypothetical protein